MQIHYKTIVLAETDKMREFNGNEQYFILHTKPRSWQSPIVVAPLCCKDMEEALKEDVFYVQEVGNQKDSQEHPGMGMGLYLRTEDKYEGGSSWYLHHRMDHCPFCGEPITYVEDYKAKTITRKVHIPAKKIEARNETRTVEVKIQ